MKVAWPVAKTVIVMVLFLVCHFTIEISITLSVLICMAATMFYQDVIAMIIPNTIKMSPMDHQCFLSNTKAHVNYYNCSL